MTKRYINKNMQPTHLQIIEEAYKRVGICYVVREDEGYKYLLLCNEQTKSKFEQGDLERLCSDEGFMEFDPNGELTSY